MLGKIDPEWAWAPFEPTASQPFDLRLASHLYRRGAFGAGPAQLGDAVSLGPADAVDQLLNANENATENPT